jgi:hypothetical protein
MQSRPFPALINASTMIGISAVFVPVPLGRLADSCSMIVKPFQAVMSMYAHLLDKLKVSGVSGFKKNLKNTRLQRR